MQDAEKKKDAPQNGAMPQELAKQDQANQFRMAEAMLREKHVVVSDTVTPSYYVKDKNGLDYVDEAYMRHQLNKH